MLEKAILNHTDITNLKFDLHKNNPNTYSLYPLLNFAGFKYVPYISRFTIML